MAEKENKLFKKMSKKLNKRFSAVYTFINSAYMG